MTYDVSPDGQRLLMLRSPDAFQSFSNQVQLIAIENWFDELERLAPAFE